jgi:hypothetical protein
MCKSQHAIVVRAQHERHERKKITKSVKEICTRLNLQPPSSPIASEGKESPEIESFEGSIARFDEETLVQQWYGDANVATLALTMVEWLEHPHLTLLLTLLLQEIHKM